MELEDVVFWVWMSLVIVVLVFECGLLVYAYTHADEVECNLLWCTFTTTLNEKEETFITTTSEQKILVSQTCFINKEEVNCSTMEELYGKA